MHHIKIIVFITLRLKNYNKIRSYDVTEKKRKDKREAKDFAKPRPKWNKGNSIFMQNM